MRFVHPTDFAGQFRLAGQAAGFPGAVTRRLASLEMAIADPLPALPVRDATGQEIGLLLGTPVDVQAGRVPQGALELPEAFGGDVDAFVERHIYALSGSFVFLLDRPGFRRLYLDACGSLSAVFDPVTRRAAATSLLLLDPAEAEARFDGELHTALRILRDGWFPAGLTAHHGIVRLMPNHYLDLDRYEQVRHWPRAPVAAEDPAAACGRILASTQAVTRALIGAGPVHHALTAGNETRMLLAAARPLLSDLRFVTVAAEQAGLDLDRAREIAARFGLDHRIIPVRTGTEAEGWDWHARAGHTVGGPHVRTHPTVRALEDRPYFVGGLGGEIGRGFFWRPTDTDETPVTAEGIWARMGMPRHERGVAAVEAWLPGVEGLPGLLKLDLAYLELRMGCWGFALSYCSPRPIDIHPLISRESFSAMLALPPDWRRMQGGTNRMIGEVIRQGWPELLEFPISRYGDYRDRLSFARRALRNPHLVAKKLRKMFG